MSALACSLLPGDEIPKPEHGPGVRLSDHMALMRCRSLPEVRLKAAAMGVDADAWLRYEGAFWRPAGWDFAEMSPPEDAWLRYDGLSWRPSGAA